MAFNSAVNQPNRVFLSSQDDATVNESNRLDWNSFRITLKTPVLNAKNCQLLRATIPNAQVSIPNYQLVFWYYRKSTAPGSNPELKSVRIFPSNFVGLTYGCPINRFYANYADLLADLNTAAAAADNVGLNPYHTAGDITFAYDALTRHFSFSGQTAGYTYQLAGYEDPAVLAAQQNVFVDFIAPTGELIPQPNIPYANLNLRVGYSFPGNGGPLPYTDVVVGAPLTGDSWGDLVYSQNVVIRCNIIAGSCLSSNGLHDAICVMPIATPSLGVAQYTAPLANVLNRVMKEVFEIEITLLDDYGEPFSLPNNAIVNIELGFQYV
jgi:hypothetical protein